MEMRQGTLDSGQEACPAMSQYRLPSAACIMTVTHDMAGDWLDYRVHRDYQRRLSMAKAKQRASEMDAGLWTDPVPPGLMFNEEGYCFNGQHTLQALRDSQLTELDLWVFPGQPQSMFAKVDVLHTRHASQLYHGKYAAAITGAVRYLGPETGKYIARMAPAVQLAEVTKWPELEAHAGQVALVQQYAKIPAAAHLAIMAQAERSPHRDDIGAWLTGLIHGANLPPGDARLKLRTRFLSSRAGDRRDPAFVYNTIAKAWNLHVAGAKVQVLAWREVEGIIPVTGFER